MSSTEQKTTTENVQTSDNTQPNSKKPFSFSLVQIFLTLLSVCLAVGLVLGVYTFINLQDRIQPTSKITVDAKATRKVANNKAKTTVYIVDVGADLKKLNQVNDEKVKKILDYLKSQNISEKDLQVNKNSYPDYQTVYNASEPNKTPETRLESNIQITFQDLQKDLSRPNNILAQLTSIGVSRFDQFQYDDGDNTRVCDDLYIEALQSAIKKAEERVKAIGGSKIIRKIDQPISNCGQDMYPIYMSKDSLSTQAGQSPDAPALLNNDQELSNSVRLEVEYK